jgi:Ca2+-binding RTX toxin-like protein
VGGNDRIDGGSGNDFIVGGNGSDHIYGGNGDDQIFGGVYAPFTGGYSDGDDRIDGGNGSDTIYADSGNDRINGGNGNDSLIGYVGNDILNGGAGIDTLDGAGYLFPNTPGPTSFGEGEIDVLTGGAGVDTFKFGASNRGGWSPYYRFQGNNDYALITDFNKYEDSIELYTSFGHTPIVEVEYSLGASPQGLPTGTGIFINNSDSQPELIAILQGVSPESLSLTDSYFKLI